MPTKSYAMQLYHVANRFYSAYEPRVNAAFRHSVDVALTYKTRVIAAFRHSVNTALTYITTHRHTFVADGLPLLTSVVLTLFLLRRSASYAQYYRTMRATYPVGTTRACALGIIIIMTMASYGAQKINVYGHAITAAVFIYNISILTIISSAQILHAIFFAKDQRSKLTFSQYRQRVRSIAMPQMPWRSRSQGSTHPKSATRRTLIRKVLEGYAVALGRTSWKLAKSTHDQYSKTLGSRINRSPKDSSYYENACWDDIPRNAVITSVDDICHMNKQQLNHLLNEASDKDAIIQSYTWKPLSPAFTADEWSIAYDADCARWDFKCGDEDAYCHELWDTSPATLSSFEMSIDKTLLFSLTFAWTVYNFAFRDYTIHTLVPGTCYSWFTFESVLLPWTPSLPLPVVAASLAILIYNRVSVSLQMIYQLVRHPIVTTQAATFRKIVVFITQYIIVAFVIAALMIPAVTYVPFTVLDTVFLIPYPRTIPIMITFMYPWQVDCQTLPSAITHLCVCAGILLASTSIKSNIFMTLHSPVGVEGRTLWHIKPTATYGTLRTIWHAALVYKSLPKRIAPSIVRTPTNDAIMAMCSIRGSEMYTRLSLDGTRTSVEFTDKSIAQARAMRAASGKYSKPGYTTMQLSQDLKTPEAALLVAWLTAMDSWSSSSLPPNVVNYDEPSLVTYTVNPIEPNDKDPPMTCYLENQLIQGGAFCAAKNWANSCVGIKGRVTLLQAEPAVTKTAEHTSLMTEFLGLFQEARDKAGRGGPLRLADIDRIYDKQRKPAQLDSIDAAQHLIGAQLTYARIAQSSLNTFQKAEVVLGTKEPRNITTVDAPTKLANSLIAYSLADAAKVLPSYAFGKTPTEIAERVALVCHDSKTVLPTDFSRMDGRVKRILREFDRALLTSLFHQDLHESVLRWHSMTYSRKARSSEGVKYETKYTQSSGDPFTSVLNTLRNILIAYTALRKSGYASKAAFAELGVYGGDDGLTANLEFEYFEQAAKMWGMKVTGEPTPRGNRVEFLSRVYGPGVWHGSPSNMALFGRFCAKFPNTQTHTLKRFGKYVVAHAKACSALVNDHATPIIGPVLSRIREATRIPFIEYCKRKKLDSDEVLQSLSHWNAKISEMTAVNGYQSEIKDPEPWMEDYVESVIDRPIAAVLQEYFQSEWDVLPVLLVKGIEQHKTEVTDQNGTLIPPLEMKEVKKSPRRQHSRPFASQHEPHYRLPSKSCSRSTINRSPIDQKIEAKHATSALEPLIDPVEAGCGSKNNEFKRKPHTWDKTRPCSTAGCQHYLDKNKPKFFEICQPCYRKQSTTLKSSSVRSSTRR